jgi:hypothetical protein
MSTHRPKFNRCDFCGRNPHKVAVRLAAGIVRGYCPSCWATVTGGFGNVPPMDMTKVTVIYDNRAAAKRKRAAAPVAPNPAHHYVIQVDRDASDTVTETILEGPMGWHAAQNAWKLRDDQRVAAGISMRQLHFKVRCATDLAPVA